MVKNYYKTIKGKKYKVLGFSDNKENALRRKQRIISRNKQLKGKVAVRRIHSKHIKGKSYGIYRQK